MDLRVDENGVGTFQDCIAECACVKPLEGIECSVPEDKSAMERQCEGLVDAVSQQRGT